MSVNRSSENKLTHAFLSFLCFSRGFIQIHFGLFDFFCFVLSNKYYLSKLMLLDFRCQKIPFLCEHSFCIDEKHAQWHWDNKVKVFHESISWFMTCSERKFSVYPFLKELWLKSFISWTKQFKSNLRLKFCRQLRTLMPK